MSLMLHLQEFASLRNKRYQTLDIGLVLSLVIMMERKKAEKLDLDLAIMMDLVMAILWVHVMELQKGR